MAEHSEKGPQPLQNAEWTPRMPTLLPTYITPISGCSCSLTALKFWYIGDVTNNQPLLPIPILRRDHICNYDVSMHASIRAPRSFQHICLVTLDYLAVSVIARPDGFRLEREYFDQRSLFSSELSFKLFFFSVIIWQWGFIERSNMIWPTDHEIFL